MSVIQTEEKAIRAVLEARRKAAQAKLDAVGEVDRLKAEMVEAALREGVDVDRAIQTCRDHSRHDAARRLNIGVHALRRIAQAVKRYDRAVSTRSV